MNALKGKVALVTGSGQGLGFDISRAFAAEGAKIAMVELNPETLGEKADILRANGADVVAIEGDVRERGTAQTAVARTLRAFERIDILVNNAQLLDMPVPFVEQGDEHIDGIIRSGVFGTIYFMQAAYPALKKAGGSVINLGSGAGVIGNMGQASYAAAKEGIRGLSRVVAREWGRDQIRVNVICPAANSPSMEGWFADKPEQRAAALAQTSLGRFAEGYEDVGRLAVFLASPECFLTGQTIMIDGGQIML